MTVAQNPYLLACVAVGLAQIADAVILTKRMDRGLLGAATVLFGFAEYVWAGVSALVFVRSEYPFPVWLPGIFVVYVVTFFAAGLVVAVKSRGEAKSVPRGLAVAGGWFGAFFAVSSLLQWGNA